ncbi:ImmA/IrrE family metallo-endopeptidase [Paenibacillus gansuensis]|uniref:ImmA/IrrE family metallo-endopeptidase n=1 Tax=Paenibacillus gansuensis TaxID=306542 RepID=A0ABW5PG42_9BACL
MDKLTKKLIQRFKTNDPFVIAKGLNINVKFESFHDGTRGLYYRVLRRRFIVIHEGLDDTWKRFICAHELGHDRLHNGLNRFWLDEHSFFTPGKFEREATEFAVLLLSKGTQISDCTTIYEAALNAGIPVEFAHYLEKFVSCSNMERSEYDGILS